jgi:hypothetical protein
MSDTKAIATRPVAEIARLDPQALIASAIAEGSGVEAIERLTALARQVREDQAREAHAEAMAEFQRRCPRIVKNKTGRIHSARTGGGFEYSFASLDSILATILPILGEVGLSVSWRGGKPVPNHIVQTCRISHALGHFEESGDVAMPIPAPGDGGATMPQKVGIAMTYARRYSLLAITGIAPEDDDTDAQDEPARTIQQPRRASEKPIDLGPQGAAAAAAADAPPAFMEGPAYDVGERSAGARDSNGLVVTGVAVEKEGTKNGKAYRLFAVTFSNGTKATTWSESVADIAASFAKSGEAVLVELADTPYGPRLNGIAAEGAE